MEKRLAITEDYLYIPVCADKEDRRMEICLENEEGFPEKLYEFIVPIDGTENFACDYYAEIPVKELKGKRVSIQADMPASYADRIYNGRKREAPRQEKPLIHFAAHTGWTNDPNGLVYADGVYHLYFQYNPFGLVWNNMTWGHAVSRDLLHWNQEDSVLFPDESGVMFSGCGLTNERELLGLPRDALLFFYTAAGGGNEWSKDLEFTQRIAYSLDGGSTLVKCKSPCLPTLAKENRDPKVFWHEASKAYVMSLFMKDNDFAIFRSRDLMHWEQSDSFTLQDAWECPDLFLLTSETGENCWFFWSADGFYYQGDFDGYRFHTDGVKHCAYINRIAYAAQTYAGIKDRVISVPWLRLPNDGRTFTGAYGIPVELSCKKTSKGFALLQKPVRELKEHAEKMESGALERVSGQIVCQTKRDKKAVLIEMHMKDTAQEPYIWKINKSLVEYTPESGTFAVDGEAWQACTGCREFLFLIDDRILEVFFDGGVQTGAFVLREKDMAFETAREAVADYAAYEIM